MSNQASSSSGLGSGSQILSNELLPISDSGSTSSAQGTPNNTNRKRRYTSLTPTQRVLNELTDVTHQFNLKVFYYRIRKRSFDDLADLKDMLNCADEIIQLINSSCQWLNEMIAQNQTANANINESSDRNSSRSSPNKRARMTVSPDAQNLMTKMFEAVCSFSSTAVKIYTEFNDLPKAHRMLRSAKANIHILKESSVSLTNIIESFETSQTNEERSSPTSDESIENESMNRLQKLINEKYPDLSNRFHLFLAQQKSPNSNKK